MVICFEHADIATISLHMLKTGDAGLKPDNPGFQLLHGKFLTD
jgi:hypothetical protein